MFNNYEVEVKSVKAKIKEIITCDDNEINEIIQKYFSSGGKGLRLILTLICSKLGDNECHDKKIIHIASLVEIIHTTTLIHDDIIDGANERRGKLTLNNMFGDNKALFIGDYLFAVVLNEASKIDDVRIHSYLSETLKQLCYGEIIQYQDLYNINTRVIDYLRKIKRKTAILIAYACVSGAIVAGASPKNIENSYKFGYYLGMSYQIMDDYLDFVADEKVLGKDIGQDLVNGNVTLPIIFKIAKNKNLFLGYNNFTLSQKESLVKELKTDKEILERVKAISDKYLQKAKSVIEDFPNNIKEDLIVILEKLSNRSY